MKATVALSLLVSAILCSAAVLADTVTPEEAIAVGESFIQRQISALGGWGESPYAEISGMRELRRGDRLLGYHLSISPAGHIVVPITRALTPVKSFSYTEDYDTESEVGYWLLLKDAMEYTLVNLEERYGNLHLLKATPQPAAIGELWDNMLGSQPPPGTLTTVGPVVMTRWDQGEPFNDNCPMGDGGRCVVGCVATAGAQIMRYWRHPSYGTGSHSYYWDGDQSCGGSTPGEMLSADFDHAYDWWNMKRWYLTWSPEQGAAVAWLSSDLGIAWNMNYGVCGSSAQTSRGLTVYPTWFKYLDTVARRNRNDYASREEWFNVLRPEFDTQPPRPIHYRISGHSIVCDGYMDEGGMYIHLNYGWGGSSNGWYAVDSLYCPWAGCDPMVEYCLIGIEPGCDFIDVTDGALGDTGDTYGVAWGDYDGDTYEDLYIVNSGSANKLLENDGAGGFTDVTSGPLGDTGQGRAAAWADYDNDGDLDLYLTNTSGGANRLLRNDAGTFTDVTSAPLGDTGDGEGLVWADFDNNGYIDLYVVNNGSANKLFLNAGAGVFADATSGPLGDTGNGYGVAAGDYDGDGDQDIYIVNSGANVLLENLGGGVFTDATAGPLGDAGDGRGAEWGDYDNDEDLDIYVTNYGGANVLLRNDGGSFTALTDGPLGTTSDCWGVGWADYENDGDLDLYLGVSDGNSRYIRNRGGDEFQNANVDPVKDAGTGRAVAWGDYDNDGLSDLYLANTAGTNRLFHNEYQQDTHWLKVKLVGVYSNAAGIGARVRLVTAGGTQIREISGGSGYCSQNSLIARFGLGDMTTVDSVQVFWPSGFFVDTTVVAADQMITLVEFDVSGIEVAGEISGGFRLFPSYPNPSDGRAAIRYSLPEPGPVGVYIYDVSGRLIKTFADTREATPGEHTVYWYGDNESGAPVAPGVYFYRIEAGRFAETRRMVLLR